MHVERVNENLPKAYFPNYWSFEFTNYVVADRHGLQAVQRLALLHRMEENHMSSEKMLNVMQDQTEIHCHYCRMHLSLYHCGTWQVPPSPL